VLEGDASWHAIVTDAYQHVSGVLVARGEVDLPALGGDHIDRGNVDDPFAALNPLPAGGEWVIDDGESRALLSIKDVVEEPVFQAIHFVLLFHRMCPLLLGEGRNRPFVPRQTLAGRVKEA
jgi:hypothetical protein